MDLDASVSRELVAARAGARRKRIATEARKEQNRVAQKAFRQRRRESRQQLLQAIQRARSARNSRELRPRLDEVQRNLTGPSSAEKTGRSLLSQAAAYQRPIAFSGVHGGNMLSSAPALSTAPPSTTPTVSDRANLSELADAHYFMSFHEPHRIAILPQGPSIYLPPAASNFSPTLSQAVVHDNGLELGYADAHTERNLLGPRRATATVRVVALSASQTLPDPITNNIQFTRVTIFRAMMHNATSLGFDVSRLLTRTYISPFYRVVNPQDDLAALLASASHPSIPHHLQPTLPQILYPHHPYLDLIPYPVLRARLLALMAMMPHTFNHLDFKQDIYYHGGLVCWTANGSVQPWDMRNWEAAPWFLKKWSMVVDGQDTEIWKCSTWWWQMRDKLPRHSALSEVG